METVFIRCELNEQRDAKDKKIRPETLVLGRALDTIHCVNTDNSLYATVDFTCIDCVAMRHAKQAK